MFRVILVLLAVVFLTGREDITMAEAKEIKLTKPAVKGDVSLEEAISRRRSVRSFYSRELDWQEISQLLWAAQGITAAGLGHNLRSAPSAGALYPMELYALTKDGTYHYLPENNSLEVLGNKDLRADLAAAALGQTSVSEAPLDIVICAVYERVTGKYGARGRRYVEIEAGHIAQNIHLQAAALGLGSVPVGAFNDERVQSTLGFKQDESALYIIPVGHAKGEAR